MIAVQVTRRFYVEGADDFDAHTTAVMDELISLEDEFTSDSDVFAELSTQTVTISIIVRGDDFDALVEAGDAAIRTAIHAAGGHTPNWERAVFQTQEERAVLIGV